MTKRQDLLAHFEDYLRRADEARRKGVAHDQRRHSFLAFLDRTFGVDLDEIEIERGIEALQVRGRIDLLFRDLIFEFKCDLKAEREDGKRELLKYLSSTAAGPHSFGLLTDGVVFEVYALRGGQLVQVDAPVDLKATAEREPEAALLWLDSFLFSQTDVAPRSDDVVRRFGAGSAVYAATSTSLREMFGSLRDDRTTQTKLSEWNSLLAKVYGSRDVGTDDLFLRHTYLSLLTKVFAYFALFHSRPLGDVEPTDIVSGEVFRRRGFVNLVEEDFFSWVLAADVRDQVVALLRGLLQPLGIYDPSRINEDLLKELYQGLVDPETRHDLGEFYTPDWLAHLTLEEAGYRGEGSVLDPACGSGTFLFTAIQMARAHGKTGKELVDYAQASIMGVDVHPLAVTTARVNYALALAHDLPRRQRGVVIPVYMADALLREEVRKTSTPIKVVVSTEERKVVPRRGRKPKKEPTEVAFAIPSAVARAPEALDDILKTLCDYAQQPGDIEPLLAGFRAYLGTHRHGSDLLAAAQWQSNLKLMLKLVRARRDTIWGFILRNAYRPIYLSDRRFDFVVGNPPWLAYRYIQDERYQAQVKELCFAYRLLEKSQVNLFTVMDTSSLFFEFCYNRYVKPEGMLAFVMPKSVLRGAKQHAAFQRMGFTCGLDLEEVKPLFRVPACVLARRKREGEVRLAGIPMQQVRGELPERNMPWATAGEVLELSAGSYSPLPEAAVSPYWSSLKAGASIFPRCFWFVEPAAADGVGVVDPAEPYLQTAEAIQKDAKAPWKGMHFRGTVEADFLYATLLGRDLLPFGYLALELIVLPLTPVGDTGMIGLLTQRDAVSRGYLGLAEWLRGAETAWQAKKKPTSDRTIYQRLDYQGTLSTQTLTGCHKMLYNTSGTHLAACVVDATAPLAVGGIDVHGFVADMVTYHREFQDESEAHYLCAVLNSSTVNLAIKPHQTGGQWGERHVTRLPFEVLPIPLYDPGNAAHRELAAISLECHATVAHIAPQMAKGGIGRQRQEIRRMLQPGLQRIDGLVCRLLAEAVLAAPRERTRDARDLFGGG